MNGCGSPNNRSAAATAPALDRVRQMICSLHGHDLLLHFEHDRLSLRCAACAWESPGWTIEGRQVSPSPDEDSS
ncbi:MAG: hypothetical protein HY657_00315 [Acidobacteria bacterium]|nr:hypothetical protein [Acidobacteriota bacterium]